VELLTPEGECIASQKLKIENGQCHSDFKLDSTYRSGFYEVRAYTRSMLNFGDEVIFSRVFPIYQEPEDDGDYSKKFMDEPYSRDLKDKREKEDKRKEVNVDFYPEGGSVIQGLPNRVAFKVSGKEGQNLTVDGKVYNSKNEVVTVFSTIHQGMGLFDLFPEPGNYKVVVTYNNKDYTFNLPAFSVSGYTLQLNNFKEDALSIQIQKTPEIADEILGLTVSCRGKPCFFDTLTVGTQPYGLKIPTRMLPAGVNMLTLFNANGEVLSERLFFVHHPPEMTLTYRQNQERYKPLEKIQLTFEARNEEGNPAAATFSVSVRDAGTSSVADGGETMQTNLLLSSDLKGYIEQPGYYFESQDNAHRQALDLLMMTQGWRRYYWKRITGLERFETPHPIEESLMIKGSVLHPRWDKPLADVKISFFMTKKDLPGHSDAGKTDDAGCFAFVDTGLNVSGQWDLTLQTFDNNNKLLKSRILLDRWFSPKGKAYSSYEKRDNGRLLVFEKEPESETGRSIKDVQILQEVTVKAKKKAKIKPNTVYYVAREINELADKGMFYPATVADYLMEKDNDFTIDAINGSWYYNDKMLLACFNDYLDKKYNCYDCIAAFNIERVNKIFFYKNPYVWREIVCCNCLRGGESMSMHNNNDALPLVLIEVWEDNRFINVPGSMRLTSFEGFAYSQEFAKTLIKKPVAAGDLDYRRTIYWNPDVSTDDNGQASVDFYNNSVAKRIIVDCEGMMKETK
jgi:hypothetical protein